MTKSFEIWTRRSNLDEWTLYGVFNSEQEVRDELPHIEFLSLAIQRRQKKP